jgi:hypothetical protein
MQRWPAGTMPDNEVVQQADLGTRERVSWAAMRMPRRVWTAEAIERIINRRRGHGALTTAT